MRIDIPAETAAVFANDGRVFFDLDQLINEWSDYLDNAPDAGDWTNGMRFVIDNIRDNKEVMLLENITGIDNDTEGN